MYRIPLSGQECTAWLWNPPHGCDSLFCVRVSIQPVCHSIIRKREELTNPAHLQPGYPNNQAVATTRSSQKRVDDIPRNLAESGFCCTWVLLLKSHTMTNDLGTRTRRDEAHGGVIQKIIGRRKRHNRPLLRFIHWFWDISELLLLCLYIPFALCCEIFLQAPWVWWLLVEASIVSGTHLNHFSWVHFSQTQRLFEQWPTVCDVVVVIVCFSV